MYHIVFTYAMRYLTLVGQSLHMWSVEVGCWPLQQLMMAVRAMGWNV